MKTLNVLVGCTERRVSNPIEVVLHDACFNYAAINCATAGRIDELMRKGSMQGLDLIIVAADNLMPAPGRRFLQSDEALGAIQTIKSRVATPIIVVGGVEQELQFMEAGIEAVVGLPLKGEMLRAAVCQALRVPETVEKVEESQASSGSFWRRLQKVMSAS